MSTKQDEIRNKMKAFLDKVNEPVPEVIKVKKRHVPESKDKHALYFEGEIQLRNVTREMVDFVVDQIEKAKAHVPELTTRSDRDFDLKVSDKRLLRRIAKELQKKHGGTLKESERLFTRDHQTQKEVFRLNVYYKKPECSVGDFVVADNIVSRILSFNKEQAKFQSLESDRSFHSAISNISSTLKRIKCEVMEIYPDVKVLDDNFQPVPVMNVQDKSLFKIGQKEKFVFNDGKAYLT